jgi:hypothetical protein
MELTPSLVALLQPFGPVFTTPTFTTFVQIVAGWVFSQRHLFITEIIFSGGNVGDGHWSRFHRFFSHAACTLDDFALVLARLILAILAPGATLLWAVSDSTGTGSRTHQIGGALVPRQHHRRHRR